MGSRLLPWKLFSPPEQLSERRGERDVLDNHPEWYPFCTSDSVSIFVTPIGRVDTPVFSGHCAFSIVLGGPRLFENLAVVDTDRVIAAVIAVQESDRERESHYQSVTCTRAISGVQRSRIWIRGSR